MPIVEATNPEAEYAPCIPPPNKCYDRRCRNTPKNSNRKDIMLREADLRSQRQDGRVEVSRRDVTKRITTLALGPVQR